MSGRERIVYWTAVGCFVLCGAALLSGATRGALLADDWDHYAMERGSYPVARSWLDHFNFVADSDSERAALMASGRLPWWTDSAIHLAAWRPVSSALQHVDFAALQAGRDPRAAHWHSLLWWSVLVLGVGAAFAEFLPLTAAAAAAALYTLDDAHVLPAAWLANRSELVSNAFAFWALWAHLRWRARGAQPLRALSIALVGLSLLSGEHALAPLGYILALEIRRPRVLAPFAALVAAYLVARSSLGYGIAGSDYYIDPMQQPGRFVSAFATRLPALANDLVFGMPAEAAFMPPAWLRVVPRSLASVQQIQTVLGVLALGLIAAILVRLRHAKDTPGAPIRWALSGSLLALVPVTATLPMSRLTVAAAFGLDATLGVWLVHLFGKLRSSKAPAMLAGIIAIIGLHVVRPAMRTADDVAMYVARSRIEQQWVARADLGAGARPEHVFVTSALDWATQFVLPTIATAGQRREPFTCHILSPINIGALQLTRLTPNALELRAQLPRDAPAMTASVYRPASHTLRVGDRVRLPEFAVTVLEVEHSEPTRLRFDFEHTLDDARYTFVHPFVSGLHAFALPAVGVAMQLPAPAWPH